MVIMKCCSVILTLVCIIYNVNAAELKIKEQLQAMADQIAILKSSHAKEINGLKKEVEDLKLVAAIHVPDNCDRNQQATLTWTKRAMEELRVEIRELGDDINNSALLKQLHNIRNELKQALMDTSDLARLGRTQETRIDKLDSGVGRLKYEVQQMRTMMADQRVHFSKLAKEVKTKILENVNAENDVLEPHEIRAGELKVEHNHKYRHNKMIHAQISRLAHTQDQLEEFQQSLQTQILDVQRRMDRFVEPNWNLFSAKLDILELETKVTRNELKNTTQKVSDFDKVHASILELREDVESIENKADKTIPEFRKEISKLEVDLAQLNAQSSYIKEDQENLRQSVKAIAVSVSNAIDRAEMDRLFMKKVNDSVCELESRARQHFYKLNDHILKSETNGDFNQSEVIPLPELMVEVKELQPVQREYVDLVNQLPRDCSSISGPAGIYLIHPGQAPFETWCMNGSTLMQRRYNGSVEFNRKFAEYVHGFGNPSSEYWLGLESMHLLTSDNCTSMRIDMTDIYGANWYAEYERFYVGSADTGYVLHISGFDGNASDAFEYQNHMEFSAIDRDRDISNTHCAGNYEGGWWYSHCQHVNINGKYTLGLTWFDATRNEWIAVASSEMRMYRRPGCS